MKLPFDLIEGDIFHIDNHKPLNCSPRRYEKAIFKEYVQSKVLWAKTDTYSFVVEDGIAHPTNITVIRIQRVTSK